ncbi:hypothetical protein D910_05071 [Dendroctonus ponderosae]|uniref:Uncharacterized protein n=1 Tax=Dendroctonus ponderosae TaxID=77166 RepID=U4UAP2_DENPD|nr:hypothetical protein D910_05071 [Dendroctonus ponderosae]
MLASPPSAIHDGFATIRRPRVGLPRKPPRPPSLASVPEDNRSYEANGLNRFSYGTYTLVGVGDQEEQISVLSAVGYANS